MIIRFGSLALASAGVLLACSLEGLAGGTRADAGADSAAPPSGRDSGPDAVGCPSCEVLVSQEDRPTELLQGGERLYWIRAGTTTGYVVSSDLDGRDVTFEPRSPVVDPHDLVMLPPNVFLLAGDEIHRRLSSSTCNDSRGFHRLAMFGGELLMLRSGELARGGCDGSRVVVTDSIVAVTGSPPYAWYARTDGTIVRCDALAQCASSQAVLASGQGNVSLMANDDVYVFWLSTDTREIRARSKSAIGVPGEPSVLASTTLPKTLVPAGGDLYWTDLEEGTVVRAPATGGAPVVVAGGLNRPWGLVVTATYIYVAESGAGRIVRFPR